MSKTAREAIAAKVWKLAERRALSDEWADAILQALREEGYVCVPIPCLWTVSNLLQEKWPTMADTVRDFAMISPPQG